MSIDALSHSSHTEAQSHDAETSSHPTRSQMSSYGANDVMNSMSEFSRLANDVAEPTGRTSSSGANNSGGFDLFSALGSLFGGAQQGGSAEQFDLYALLSSIFDFAGTQAANASAANGGPSPSNPDVVIQREDAGVKEEANWSGETGDEHFQAKGHANAEVHATTKTFTEAVNDGKSVKARAHVEARAGMSAQAQGSVHTDVGDVQGKARVSNEAFVIADAQAEAGPNGASAEAMNAVGALAQAKGETTMTMAEGLVQGSADARAEAGAGAQAKGKVGVSFAPPQMAVNAKAEAFAGARAGYSAKGGVAGVGYGIECEVWAGIGAKAEVNGGIDKDGKLKLEFALGIAYGVGGQVKFGVELDLKEVAKNASKVIGFLGGGFLGAIAGMFGGGAGNGEHAAKAVTDTAQKLAPAMGQAASNAVGPQLQQVVDDTQHEESFEETHEESMSHALT